MASEMNIENKTKSIMQELLDKLEKRICRTAGRSLAASLEIEAHR